MKLSGQLNAPTALPLEETAPGSHSMGGWSIPRVGLDALEKRKLWHLSGVEPRSLYRLSCHQGAEIVFTVKEEE
jgi:hypothetical protein